MADQIPFTRGVPSADLLPVADLRAAAAAAFEADAAAVLCTLPPDIRRLGAGSPSAMARRPTASSSSTDPGGGRLPGPASLRRRAGDRDRRGADLRPHAQGASGPRRADRARAAGGRRTRPRAARGAARGDAAPAGGLPDPDLPEPLRPVHVAREAPGDRGAGPRARRPGDRGRPVRPPAVRGRAAAVAPRARRRRERHPLLVVHEDDRARRAHRLPAPARAPGRSAPAALDEHHHRAEHARGGGRRRLLRAGRFEPNIARVIGELRKRRDAMEEALRDGFPAGSRSTTPAGGYSSGSSSPGSTPSPRCPLRRARRGVRAGADFCASGGGRSAVRLAFSACGPDAIREGIARLGPCSRPSARPPPRFRIDSSAASGDCPAGRRGARCEAQGHVRDDRRRRGQALVSAPPALATIAPTPDSTWQTNGRVIAIAVSGNTVYLGARSPRSGSRGPDRIRTMSPRSTSRPAQ